MEPTMDPILVIALTPTVFIAKGDAYKSLDHVFQHLKRFWPDAPLTVRNATRDEFTYWKGSINAGTCKFVDSRYNDAFTRLYNPDVAAAVTSTGQLNLREQLDVVNSLVAQIEAVESRGGGQFGDH